jgi:ribosomal peptide maturation radical SAM protein 1
MIRLPGVKGDPAHLDPEIRSARAEWPVALVAMPFVPAMRPSIQLGLLASIAASHGFPTATLHLNLDFAQQIGLKRYELFCGHRERFFGDWLFSLEAFGDQAPDPEDRLLEAFSFDVDRLLADIEVTPERLRALRHEEVPRYLDRMIDAIPWSRFRVVGFTSTFQQNAASFALAARIKQRFPHVQILFGGANFEGEMGLELVRSIPCIDYAVIGEGDLAFPEFLIALQEGRDPAEVPGVVCRRDGVVTPLQMRSPFRQMDDLPVPDYEEYFERAETLGLLPVAPRREMYIPFESARGCWWGEKQHCTFCGLNGLGMPFRAKSPDRLLDELAELARRYRSFQFEAVDNILDMSYLKSLFARITEAGCDYQFFYELKANLTREQIKTLRDGGVRDMQPGIESLSSHVLKLMRKGVAASRNVNTLRWAYYYNIDVSWNLIWGFPGETEEDYRQQSALLRHLFHLPPPDGAGRIWMERYSPIFSDRSSFPARYVQPEASYAYVYPRDVDLDRMAYFFDYELEGTLPASVYEETARQVEAWKCAWNGRSRPTLTFWSAPDFLQIEDRRDPAVPGTYTFSGPLAPLYAACSDRPQSAVGLKSLLELEWPAGEIEASLDEFCARGLMMRDDKVFLSLALPAMRGR